VKLTEEGFAFRVKRLFGGQGKFNEREVWGVPSSEKLWRIFDISLSAGVKAEKKCKI